VSTGATGHGGGYGGAPADPPALELLLYVGDAAAERSRRAVANLRALVGRMPAEPRVEVVDVTRTPDAAERERILATPTLVLRGPLGTRRVIGDLSEPGVVLRALGLPPGP
jgi:circadian clock protein KaiB